MEQSSLDKLTDRPMGGRSLNGHLGLTFDIQQSAGRLGILLGETNIETAYSTGLKAVQIARLIH